MRLEIAVLFAVTAMAVHPAGARDCPPLDVTVTQDDPTRASLAWAQGPGAIGYFLQYSTGKFPTQISLDAQAEPEMVTAELHSLRPGRAYAIEICTAYAHGACPARPDAPNACVAIVEIIAARAYPDVVQDDPAAPVCREERDRAWLGHLTDEANGRAVAAADNAASCCSICAWTEGNLPYSGACTHFTFDPTARQCILYRDTVGLTAAPGAIAGAVRAWPKP